MDEFTSDEKQDSLVQSASQDNFVVKNFTLAKKRCLQKFLVTLTKKLIELKVSKDTS
jgi:hypothetical protein